MTTGRISYFFGSFIFFFSLTCLGQFPLPADDLLIIPPRFFLKTNPLPQKIKLELFKQITQEQCQSSEAQGDLGFEKKFQENVYEQHKNDYWAWGKRCVSEVRMAFESYFYYDFHPKTEYYFTQVCVFEGEDLTPEMRAMSQVDWKTWNLAKDKADTDQITRRHRGEVEYGKFINDKFYMWTTWTSYPSCQNWRRTN